MSYKSEAKSSEKAKLKRMLASNNPVAKEATAYATLGNNNLAIDRQKVPTRAKGGRVKHEDAAQDRKLFREMLADSERAEARRLDRVPRRASGGKVNGRGTNVNVIVAPRGGEQPPMPMMGAAPAPRPPMPPPAPPPMPPGMMGGAPGMPPGMPMRKKGGRVKMTAGSESGEGRLQKIAIQKRTYP